MYRNDDDRLWSTLAHVSALTGLIFSFWGLLCGFIGPLIIWLIKKDQSPIIADHAKEALNFNISFTLYHLIATFTIFLIVGIALVPIVYIAWLVLLIIGSVKSYQGQYYRYPLVIRFIK